MSPPVEGIKGYLKGCWGLQIKIQNFEPVFWAWIAYLGIFFFVVFLLTITCNGEFLHVLEECDLMKEINSCCSERNKNRYLEQYGETPDLVSVTCAVSSILSKFWCSVSSQLSDFWQCKGNNLVSWDTELYFKKMGKVSLLGFAPNPKSVAWVSYT